MKILNIILATLAISLTASITNAAGAGVITIAGQKACVGTFQYYDKFQCLEEILGYEKVIATKFFDGKTCADLKKMSGKELFRWGRSFTKWRNDNYGDEYSFRAGFVENEAIAVCAREMENEGKL